MPSVVNSQPVQLNPSYLRLVVNIAVKALFFAHTGKIGSAVSTHINATSVRRRLFLMTKFARTLLGPSLLRKETA